MLGFRCLTLACSLALLTVEATNPFKSGTYTRSKINTECNLPDQCDYKCSAAYTVTAGTDNSLVGVPTAKPDRCTCVSLTATVDTATGKAAGTSTDSQSSYTITNPSDGTLQVVMTAQSVTCTSEYTMSSTPAPSSGQALGVGFYQVTAVATALALQAIE